MTTTNSVSCHDPHSGAKGTRGQLRANQHPPFAKGECSSCHTGRGSPTLKARGSALCFTCHESAPQAFAKKFRHAPVVFNDTAPTEIDTLSQAQQLAPWDLRNGLI